MNLRINRSTSIKCILFLAFTFLCLTTFVSSENTSVTSGRIGVAVVETLANSNNWGGIKVTHSGTDLSPSTTPFTTIGMTLPLILSVAFDGDNFKNDNFYYLASHANTFNILNVNNVTGDGSDLLEDQIFNSSHFSNFYVNNYSTYNDNPNFTFCCNTDIVQLAGRNFTAYKITLNQSIDYYLLNYNISGSDSPLFLVENQDATCYNNSACVGQFMLPVSNFSYYFYMLSEDTAYNYTVFIDGVQTNNFTQVAWIYNVTVEVHDLFAATPVPGVNVVIGEENGQSLFIPKPLSGYVSTLYSAGLSDSDGREYFLGAPTGYADPDNYSIFVAVLESGELVSRQSLDIGETNSFSFQSKPITNTLLSDTSKVAVNAMNQIVNSLFTWANDNRAREYVVIYNLSDGEFYVSSSQGDNVTLRTGAVNKVQLVVLLGGVPQSGYQMRIKETQGYLIIDPYTGTTPLSNKTRVHLNTVPVETDIFLTPTSLGSVAANYTLEVLDGGGTVINTLYVGVDPSLTFTTSSGTFESDDQLKTVINRMNSILDSMFTNLNT